MAFAALAAGKYYVFSLWAEALARAEGTDFAANLAKAIRAMSAKKLGSN